MIPGSAGVPACLLPERSRYRGSAGGDACAPREERMNGAESLIRTLVDAGVNICFANPGTTEMPMVRAIDEMTGMRAVLGLFEGVCTGAADGDAPMASKPVVTLVVRGPVFVSGVADHPAAR